MHLFATDTGTKLTRAASTVRHDFALALRALLPLFVFPVGTALVWAMRPHGRTPGPAPYLYRVIDLGTFRVPISVAADLNDAHEVVGYSFVSTELHGVVPTRAFRWSKGRLLDLGTAGGSASIAEGLNNGGQVVGCTLDKALAKPFSMRAVLWQQGKSVVLPMLPGYNYGGASDINDRGQIVGSQTRKLHPEQDRACLWEGGRAIDLGTLPGGFSSAASRINSAGQIVGYSNGRDNNVHACLWSGGKIKDLSPPHAYYSEANAINEHGVVVGAIEPTTQDQPHVCIFRDGKARDLGALPGDDESHAKAINNKMEVVGESTSTRRQNGRRAFLWRNGEMKDLNRLIDPASGWKLDEALAINDRGEIAGNGRIGGKQHAFLLVPRSR